MLRVLIYFKFFKIILKMFIEIKKDLLSIFSLLMLFLFIYTLFGISLFG